MEFILEFIKGFDFFYLVFPVLILVFLILFRPLFCWYFKINERIVELEKINSLLLKIYLKEGRQNNPPIKKENKPEKVFLTEKEKKPTKSFLTNTKTKINLTKNRLFKKDKK